MRSKNRLKNEAKDLKEKLQHIDNVLDKHEKYYWRNCRLIHWENER